MDKDDKGQLGGDKFEAAVNGKPETLWAVSNVWISVFLALFVVAFAVWFIALEAEEASERRAAWALYCERNQWTYYGPVRGKNPTQRLGEACRSEDGALHIIPGNLK